ncbi:hypothetical protein O3P69_019116 [Scylla paramamosain]|uniref:Uncharacterized protein n=1 Tax=Scylla paramamosain TaxID=85552 RepID=A0AAW0SYP9_SCYPA
MAACGVGVCAVAGLLLAVGVGVQGMPTPLSTHRRCPPHPRPFPEQAVGRPSLTPPHPNLMVTVRKDERGRGSYTDLIIPTATYNLLGSGDGRLVEWRHVFRRTGGGLVGDVVVVAVVTGASPPNGDDMYTTSLDKVAVREMVKVVEGLEHQATFNLRDLLPSPAASLPYYQYRASEGEHCLDADWILYDARN